VHAPGAWYLLEHHQACWLADVLLPQDSLPRDTLHTVRPDDNICPDPLTRAERDRAAVVADAYGFNAHPHLRAEIYCRLE